MTGLAPRHRGGAEIAYGTPSEVLSRRESGSVRLWGSLHVVSVGVTIGVCALVADVVPSPIVWLAVGLLATALYLAATAAQFTIADASHRR